MTRVDLHIHSKCSYQPSEWFLQSLGDSESYTKPETIYSLPRQRERREQLLGKSE